MSTAAESLEVSQLRHDLETLRSGWGWLAVIGAALVVLGIVALGSLAIASLATAVFLGALLLAGGVAEVVGAFGCRGRDGFFAHLLSGVLSAVVGVLFLAAPLDALVVLTLLLTCLLLVGGIFKIVVALRERFPGWGWPLAGGLIDVALGFMICLSWPAAALWVVGLFVGVNLVFRGVHWVGLGLTLWALPRVVVSAAETLASSD
jgi:uncharacterized membrane protein HdeD (DUF308 family)